VESETSVDLENRIAGVVQAQFQLPPSLASSELRLGVKGWDSLGHMRLVNKLETEFGITFPTYMLPELIDIKGIAQAIDSLGGPLK
jgi:acyl carrier protein